MIMTDDEVEQRLESPKNLCNQLKVIKSHDQGRPEGAKQIPAEVRKLIGMIGNEAESETQVEIGKVFGVSQGTVSQASRGLVNDRKDESLSKVMNKSRSASNKIDDAHEKALDALVATLGTLGGRLCKEDDNSIKTRDLARIATDMSRVASNLKPTVAEKEPDTVMTQVVVYMPQQRKEKDYEIIEA